MKVLESDFNIPGFKFSAIECGIKYDGRLDLSLIFSDKPCNAAGMFTTNRIFAAPVKLCRERIGNPVHAVLINASNANACTGAEGYSNVLSLTEAVADKLEVDCESVLMASTGVIGVQLPETKMKEAIPLLAKGLSSEKGVLVSEAIMTTDTIPKSVSVSFLAGGREYIIGGVIKGAGMIDPNMATMLAFIMTDSPVDNMSLDRVFRRCVNKTLNSLTIDGDMSTNDTAIMLSQVSDNYLSGDDLKEFENALEYVLSSLAEMVIMDGEGATKLIRINVKGAETEDDAIKAAKAVSESMLVKTAFFGRDPNWGRIACAVGYSGAVVREESLSIFFEEIPLLVNGVPQDFDAQKIERILLKRDYSVIIDMGIGQEQASYLTTDLSYDYIKINAEYTT